MSTQSLLQQLESLLGQHHHGVAGTHLHGAEIHVREAHKSLEAFRLALQGGADLTAPAERLRRCASHLHLNQPHRFASVLKRLEHGAKA